MFADQGLDANVPASEAAMPDDSSTSSPSELDSDVEHTSDSGLESVDVWSVLYSSASEASTKRRRIEETSMRQPQF